MPSSNFTKIELSNGLKVVLKEMHHAPIASMWIWYRVGSRNEHPGITGAAHLIEHLHGSSLFGSQTISAVLDRIGGIYNAATSFDFTTFYATIPIASTSTFLAILAEQMKNRNFTQQAFDLERPVVISEREGLENEP